jgi:hypothetical protein
METWATRPTPKKLFSRAKVRSMNWSQMTKSPGASSSRKEPTAETDTMSVTPDRFNTSIRPVVDIRGAQGMSSPVAGQKNEASITDATEEQGIGRLAPRALDMAPLQFLQAGNFVEPTPTDDGEYG